MTFIEIAGGSDGRVLIPLTAVSRVEGRPDGQGGATIWLLDGKSYGVKERPDEVRIERWITPWWTRSPLRRLTLEPTVPPISLGSA
jgi:hypothetical protein